MNSTICLFSIIGFFVLAIVLFRQADTLAFQGKFEKDICYAIGLLSIFWVWHFIEILLELI